MGEFNDLSENLLERLIVVCMSMGLDPGEVKEQYIMILNDYEIRPKENAIAIITEGRNEMLLRRFLVAKGVAGCTKRTLQMYKQALEFFFRNIGKDADVITHEDIQVYIAKKLMQGWSKCSANNTRRVLSSFYNYLQREEVILKNPMNKVEAIKYRKQKEAAFTDMEVEMLRENCKTTHEKAVVELLLSTGCRAAEACSIKIDDIQNDKIYILGKGEKYRNVFLNAKAIVAINAYLKERKDINPFLFPGCVSITNNSVGANTVKKYREKWFQHPEAVDPVKAYEKESINALVRRIGKRAGVEKTHAHRFRRTCATNALRHGMPIEIVSMMLGHADLSTTQIYLDIKEDDLQMAHKKYVT